MEIQFDQLRDHVTSHNWQALKRDLSHLQEVDIASFIESLPAELALIVFRTLDKDLAAEIFANLGNERLKAGLEEGKAARSLGLDEDERALVSDLHLITLKPVIYVCNVDEESIAVEHPYVRTVKEIAAAEGAEAIVICGKIEAEIGSLESEEEKREFLEAVGLSESGLNQLIRSAYHTLGMRTFFTVGPDEDRAWTFRAGMKAPQTAGIIHTDFERGFIRAEVYKSDDLFHLGSELKVKEAGKLRLEGKEYLVQDGDIMHFRFNV